MKNPRFAVLAVCTANICRSPMMEILLRDQLDRDRFEIASAGVSGMVGQPMDAMSEMELMRHGLSADTFRSHPIDQYLVGAADLILTATASHRQAHPGGRAARHAQVVHPARVRHPLRPCRR